MSSIDDLIDGINFDLDPIFVIKLDKKVEDWFLANVEFGKSTTIYWTRNALSAMHFHDFDDVTAFASAQFGTKLVSIKEIL